MADWEKKIKESNDQISTYKIMFRDLMLKWNDKPKLRKYREWSKKMYEKVTNTDDFTDEKILIDMDLYTNTNNKDDDFDGEENFNAISTILRNLWNWLKKKKKYLEEIEKLSSLRCGKPRVGHGAKGLTCQCRLGKDNTCRYHGPGSDIA